MKASLSYDFTAFLVNIQNYGSISSSVITTSVWLCERTQQNCTSQIRPRCSFTTRLQRSCKSDIIQNTESHLSETRWGLEPCYQMKTPKCPISGTSTRLVQRQTSTLPRRLQHGLASSYVHRSGIQSFVSEESEEDFPFLLIAPQFVGSSSWHVQPDTRNDTISCSLETVSTGCTESSEEVTDDFPFVLVAPQNMRRDDWTRSPLPSKTQATRGGAWGSVVPVADKCPPMNQATFYDGNELLNKKLSLWTSGCPSTPVHSGAKPNKIIKSFDKTPPQYPPPLPDLQEFHMSHTPSKCSPCSTPKNISRPLHFHLEMKKRRSSNPIERTPIKKENMAAAFTFKTPDNSLSTPYSWNSE